MFDSEQQARTYDAIFTEYPIHLNGAIHLSEFIEDDEQVLDLGSGTGLLVGQIESELEEAILMDGSREMLRVARRNSRGDTHVQARFQELENIFKDNTFDTVASNYALHYAENPVETVNSIYNKLKSGGKLILEDSSQEKWHKSEFYTQLMNELRPNREQVDRENYFDINQILSESDFQNYETDTEEYKLQNNDFLKIIEGTLYFQDPSQNLEQIKERAESIDQEIAYNQESGFKHTAVVVEK